MKGIAILYFMAVGYLTSKSGFDKRLAAVAIAAYDHLLDHTVDVTERRLLTPVDPPAPGSTV